MSVIVLIFYFRFMGVVSICEIVPCSRFLCVRMYWRNSCHTDVTFVTVW